MSKSEVFVVVEVVDVRDVSRFICYFVFCCCSENIQNTCMLNVWIFDVSWKIWLHACVLHVSWSRVWFNFDVTKSPQENSSNRECSETVWTFTQVSPIHIYSQPKFYIWKQNRPFNVFWHTINMTSSKISFYQFILNLLFIASKNVVLLKKVFFVFNCLFLKLRANLKQFSGTFQCPKKINFQYPKL